MSSHVMLGTSTTVSRREEGLDTPSAYLKCSCGVWWGKGLVIRGGVRWGGCGCV